MAWSQEHLDLLHKLWLVDGLSASEITKHFPYSRNAIIGAVHRKGWKRDPAMNVASMERVYAPMRQAKAERLEARAHLKREKPKAPPPVVYTPAFNIVRSNTEQLEPVYVKPLAQACPPAHGCKWPIGDPGEEGFGFCGAAKVGKVYCAQHAEMAYRPSKLLNPMWANIR